jgi:hypothetical protein
MTIESGGTVYVPSEMENEYLNCGGYGIDIHDGGRILYTDIGHGKVDLVGSFVSFINRSTAPEDLTGLQLLDLIFGGDGSGTFEAASSMLVLYEPDAPGFVIGAVIIRDGFNLKLWNLQDNIMDVERESVFVNDLEIDFCSKLDVANLFLFVHGNVESTLDSWIADGRLFNSMGMIEAVYMPDYNWTVIPEPTTVVLLSLGVLTLLRRRRA